MPDGQIVAGSKFPRFGASPACLTILLAFAAFNVLFNAIGLPAAVTRWNYVALGVLLMQPMLLAVWASLGPGAMATRMPLVLAAFTFVVFASCYKQWNVVPMQNSLPLNIDWKADVVLEVDEVAIPLAIFALTFVLGTIGGRFGQRRIAHVHPLISAKTDKSQFSMKYLLGVMAICAALLVMARPITFKMEWPFSWAIVTTQLVLATLVLTFGLLFPIILSMIALSRKIFTRRHVALLAGGAPVTLVIALVIAATLPGTFYDAFEDLLLVQAGAIMAGVLTALPLRGAGYRFVKQPAAATGTHFLSERWL